MFEAQNSGNKTSSEEIGLSIRALRFPKWESIRYPEESASPCWYARLAAYIPLKTFETQMKSRIRYI